MKKYLTLLLIGLLSIVMAACTADKETKESNTTQEDITTEESSHDFAEESEDKSAGDRLIPIGETVETEGGTFTFHARNDRVKIIETASLSINFDQIATLSGELIGDFKEYVGRDAIEYIQLDIEIINSSSDALNFDAYQASIVTSTGEEIDAPTPELSSQVDGKFGAEEKKHGSIFYLLEESKAKDVEWVQIIIEGPRNENDEKVGEDINIKVKL